MRQLFLLLLLSNMAWAIDRGSSPTTLLRPVCSRSHEYALKLLNTRGMSMGIANPNGSFGTGLCWWQSRFHRAALYLMTFNAEAPKPSSSEARAIMNQVAHFKPVTVPGFADLLSFTQSFPKELESVLSNWELRDTTSNPIRPIANWMSVKLNSKSYLSRLANQNAYDLLQDMQATPRPIFVYIEGGSFEHAILAISYQEEPDHSVTLKYIDSNSPEVISSSKLLDTQGSFVNSSFNFGKNENSYFLHQGFDEDFGRIEKGLRTVCGSNYQIKFR